MQNEALLEEISRACGPLGKVSIINNELTDAIDCKLDSRTGKYTLIINGRVLVSASALKINLAIEAFVSGYFAAK